MSFFNKIFGGGDNEKQKKAPGPAKPKPETTEEKKLKFEKATVTLDAKISEFEDKERKFQHKIDLLKAKAKDLMGNGKQKEAKKVVEEATRVQKQMEGITLRRKALIDKKYQLEQASMDMDTIDVIEDANVHIKEQQKYSEKLEDIILEGQQAKMQQQQINDKLKDLVNDDEADQEVDDMMAELMGEVKSEKQKKIAGQQINANVPAQKQTTKAKEQDDIEKMLAELG